MVRPHEISLELELWAILILMRYVIKSVNMRYHDSGMISENLQLWDIVILVKYLIKYTNMIYCDTGEISHKIYKYEIWWSWCNITWNIQLWESIISESYHMDYRIMKYLTKSENMRFCDPFQISHLTWNYDILLYFN